ncbi:GNAT family N-acetyltransferase [Dyella silvatica]|uniref:GNAT family N-acetyltransferase n=1 Tax=Dyella silvatica TaxID=2992128 RepID=UPI00224C8F15|nr:GNAT family N-acetyltransferase [Dyella silvatica]
MDETVLIRDNPSAHRFEAAVDGEVAVATYRIDGQAITFIHTVVPQGLRGRGIATQLIRVALAQSQARHLGVVPQCPLFAAYMQSHPETHALLAPQGRILLGLA